jgi:hypothetical protein
VSIESKHGCLTIGTDASSRLEMAAPEAALTTAIFRRALVTALLLLVQMVAMMDKLDMTSS